MSLSDPMTIDAFRASAARMTPADFIAAGIDSSWEQGPHTRSVTVYADRFYIEQLADGAFCLTIANGSWITSDTTSLADLEEILFDYARSDQDPVASEG